MRDIVMLIKLDAGIVSRVLHVANSVYYNKSGERCLAVDEAIGRVGYDQIYEMVSYAASAQLLGSRAMGSIPEFVSQFEISPAYSQINYQGRPVRVSPQRHFMT